MKSCAVIGCGAAGIIASSLLRQHGLLVTCFEMSNDAGGMWNGNSHDNFTECGANIPLYPSMTCVIPKDLMSFSDFRFDFTTPQFAHHTAVRNYLSRFAAYKGVRALTRFNTKVQSVRWDKKDQMWKLITINSYNGDVMQWSFENVCVCTGHIHTPRYPPHIHKILHNFIQHRAGEVTHACYYKHWRECKGKRVVVVGDGVTAWQYSQGLRMLGADVFLSSVLPVLPQLHKSKQQQYSLFHSTQQSFCDINNNNNDSSNLGSNTSEKMNKTHRKARMLRYMSYSFTSIVSFWRLVLQLTGWHRDVRHGVTIIQNWLSHRYTDMSLIPQVGYPVSCDERGILFSALPQVKPLHALAPSLYSNKYNRCNNNERITVGKNDVSSFNKNISSIRNTNSNDNGIFVDNVDLVICATGFRSHYPFLHSDIRQVLQQSNEKRLLQSSQIKYSNNNNSSNRSNSCNTDIKQSQNNNKVNADDKRKNKCESTSSMHSHYNTRGLYLGTLWKDNPTLAFIGIQRELLPPFLLFEAQARFVANVFTNRVNLPSDTNAMSEHEVLLCKDYPQLVQLYNPNGLGLQSAIYFNVLQAQRSSRVSSSTSHATYIVYILKRQW